VSPTAHEDLVATMRFGHRGLSASRDEYDERLSQHVESRATRRSCNNELPLAANIAASLCAFAEESGGRLDVVTDKDELASLGEIIAHEDKLRFVNPLLHAELVSELRWSEIEALRRRDGLDLRSLELTPTDIAAMRLLRSADVLRTLREIGGGEGLKRSARKAVAGAAAVGLLRLPGERSRRAYLEGGRLMQRIWLWAEAKDFGLHPMTGFLYWFEPEAALHEKMADLDAAGAGFDAAEKRELSALRNSFLSHFPAVDGAEILFFRIVRTRSPALRSLRRSVAETLTVV
jgi:hypothetical protein